MLPIYFIPAANAMSQELLQQHGLDRLIGPSTTSVQTFSGPGGVTGMLVADASVPTEMVAYVADKQTWSPRFGYTSLVGTYNDHPPTEAELARDQQVGGTSVKLLDNTHWNVPILRAWREGDTLEYDARLPRVMQQCRNTGTWLVTHVVPQYRELWELSLKIADGLFAQLRGSDSASLDVGDIFEFAVQLLAVNYRVDAALLSHLQVLHPDLCAEITRQALDFDTLRAKLKNVLSRLSSGGTNSESGATPQTAD